MTLREIIELKIFSCYPIDCMEQIIISEKLEIDYLIKCYEKLEEYEACSKLLEINRKLKKN